MRKWSKQAFLNAADSNDDGWYKFSLRPLGRHRANTLGINVQYIISDCSNKIYLEFEPDLVSLNGDGSPKEIGVAEAGIKSAQIRRKKIRAFADAVALSADKIEEALWEYEEAVRDALDIADA